MNMSLLTGDDKGNNVSVVASCACDMTHALQIVIESPALTLVW